MEAALRPVSSKRKKKGTSPVERRRVKEREVVVGRDKGKSLDTTRIKHLSTLGQADGRDHQSLGAGLVDQNLINAQLWESRN